MIFKSNYFPAGAAFAAAVVLLAATISPASAWTKTEIDKAISANVDIEALRSCASNPDGEFKQRVEVTDFNKDGVEELVVYSVIYSLSRCQGPNGRQADLLISDGKGGWHLTRIERADGLKVLPRSDSSWPDLAADDYSGCLPVWRHDGKAYHLWKHCGANGQVQLINAPAAAPEIAAVPRRNTDRDNGVRPVEVVDIKTFDGIPFDHNGSMMLVNPDKGMIVYLEPKRSIARTVKPGTVLFLGDPWDISGDTSGIVLDGMAFTFKRGCEAAAYNVRGRYSLHFGNRQFELEGAAPVRAKKGCAVTHYDMTSANAKLAFDLAWE